MQTLEGNGRSHQIPIGFSSDSTQRVFPLGKDLHFIVHSDNENSITNPRQVHRQWR